MLAVYAGAWLAQTAQSVLVAARSRKRRCASLRRELFEHLQTLSLSFFDHHPHGELMSRLTNDMDAINRVLSQNVTQLFSGLLTLVGIMVMMFVLNVWLALASMIVLPADGVAGGLCGQAHAQRLSRVPDADLGSSTASWRRCSAGSA